MNSLDQHDGQPSEQGCSHGEACVVYLARHATPDWNRRDIPYHLPPGPPLTEQGVIEAQALGAYLRQAGVCNLISSPLERCQRTAQIVAGLAKVDVEIDAALQELQPGESEAAVEERALPVFLKACRQGVCSGPVAIITHGGVAKALLHALGMDTQELARQPRYDHGNLLPPGAAWQVEGCSEDGSWSLKPVFIPEAETQYS